MAITESTATTQQGTTAATQGNDTNLKVNLDHISPASGTLDLSLDLPKAQEQTTTTNTDRLKQEDEATKTPEEKPTQVEIAPNQPIVEEKKSTTLQENLPKKDAPDTQSQMSLEDDMKIIQDIQKTETILPTTPVKQESLIVEPSTLNLDNILGGGILQTSVPVETPASNPFDLIKTTTPQQPILNSQSSISQSTAIKSPITNNQGPTSKTKGVKIAMFFMLFIALGFTGYFILKTMYPLEFASNSTITGETLITTGEIITGEILTGTEIAVIDTVIADTGHASADEMFSDLTDLAAATGDQTATQLSQLTTYSEQGKLFFDRGKEINDKVMMKFGGYIWKKADALIIALESGEVLDISMVPNYLAQFSGYLSQLQALQPNANTSSSENTTQDSGLTPTQ